MWFGRTPDACLHHLMPHPCHFNFPLSLSSLLPASSMQVAYLLVYSFYNFFLSNTNAWLLLSTAGNGNTRPGIKDVASNTCDGITPTYTRAEYKNQEFQSGKWPPFLKGRTDCLPLCQGMKSPNPVLKKRRASLSLQKGKLQCRAVLLIRVKKALDINQTDFAFFDTGTNRG